MKVRDPYTPAAWPEAGEEALQSIAKTGETRGHARTLNRIRAANLAGKRNKVKYLGGVYLNSYSAKLAAAELALRAMKPHRRPPKALVPSIASALDAWTGATEEVRVNFVPKGSDPDNRRIVMDFGPENRARQYLVLRLLRAIADLHPHQFANRGRGTHAAIKHVAEAMKDGFAWAVEIDIENCFPSFDGDKVADLLPLPKEVTERVLLARHLNLVPGNLLDLLGCEPGGVHQGIPYGVPHTPHFGPAGGLGILGAQILAEARQGIPQGSAASPLLAEMLLASALRQLPTGGEVFAYLDNFLVMAKSEQNAVSMTIALGSALKAHPAGPLRPKIKGRFRPGEPIEFLGHRLTAHHGTVTIEPSPLNQQKFEVTMKVGLARIKGNPFSPAVRARKIRELRKYVCSWASAFKLWPQAVIHQEQWLAKIADVS